MAKAINPKPIDESIDIELNPVLCWSSNGASSSVLYFGTDEDDVTNGDSSTLLAMIEDEYYQCSGLVRGTTYYWRVDVFIDSELVEGDVWSFEVNHSNWLHDWIPPVEERISFNTEILQSHNRTEQRLALRDGYPRAYYTFDLYLTAAEWRTLDVLMNKWVKRKWPVPIWTDVQEYNGTLSAGASSISVDTSYANFRDNKYAVVYQPGTWEIVLIDTVSASSFTLSSNLANTFSTKSWVMPCEFGYIVDYAEVEITRGYSRIKMTFSVEDLYTISGFTAEVTYDSMTVLHDPSLFMAAEGAEERHSPDITFLDYGTGPYTVISNATYNEVVMPHRWRCETAADCWWVRQFLHSVKGRQKSFLRPTFNADMHLTVQAGASDSTIYVTDNDMTTHMATRNRNYVAFNVNNNLVVRKVTGIADSGDDEALTLDDVAGSIYPIGTPLCWVDKCRLSENDVIFTWKCQNYFECDTPLVRV